VIFNQKLPFCFTSYDLDSAWLMRGKLPHDFMWEKKKKTAGRL